MEAALCWLPFLAVRGKVNYRCSGRVERLDASGLTCHHEPVEHANLLELREQQIESPFAIVPTFHFCAFRLESYLSDL